MLRSMMQAPHVMQGVIGMRQDRFIGFMIAYSYTYLEVALVGGSSSPERRAKFITSAKRKQMSGGGNQPSAKRPRRNSASLRDLPPDAMHIVLVYAFPKKDVHRLEFVGIMGAVCRSFRKLMRTVWAPCCFDLDRYREYTPLAGPDREPRDCRLALLKSLAKTPRQRRMVCLINISRTSLEKEPSSIINGNLRLGRICNAILKALQALLSMTFPNVKSIFIDLCPCQKIYDKNISLINKNVMKKIPSAFPRLARIRFGHCLDQDTVFDGHLVKFFKELKQPLTFLSLLRIPFLQQFHVAEILRCIGSGLTALEVIGGGVDGYQMWEQRTARENSMYDALSTHCRQLQGLTLSLLQVTKQHLGKVLDLEETLTVLKLHGNTYVVNDTEEFLANLFKNKGKNLERFECDFRWEEDGEAALRNLIALQKGGG